jgi:hypothetical protein
VLPVRLLRIRPMLLPARCLAAKRAAVRGLRRAKMLGRVALRELDKALRDPKE